MNIKPGFEKIFDRVPRNVLRYKLHQKRLSTKMVKCIDQIYQNTKSVVWNGIALSDYFETNSGVKQGCLLSPLLFALYLDDMNESLNGAING